MNVLGCDPGLSGAIALWNPDLRALVIHDAPTFTVRVGSSAKRVVYNEDEYARLVRALRPERALIEQVNGIKGQSASASFNFGLGAGLLHGIMVALKVPRAYVPPATWRSRMRVPPGKDGSRQRASQLFPEYAHYFVRAMDDGRAEAALIAACPGLFPD